jgi:hypothetical protein
MKFDDVILGVIFQVKKVELEDGTMTYCMWVSRDPEDAPEYGGLADNSILSRASRIRADNNSLTHTFTTGKSVTCTGACANEIISNR